MRLVIEIGDEYKFVREELETANERALSEISAGSRGEAATQYSAGYLRAVQDLTDALESRYANLRRGNDDEDEVNARRSKRSAS